MEGPRVKRHDNQGSERYAFGFVYFTDGKRLAYTREKGATGITGQGYLVTAEHRRLATEYLTERGLIV